MRQHTFTLMLSAGLVLTGLGSTARAIDAVRTAKASVSGKIQSITTTEVTVERTNKDVEKVPVNEILSVRFDGEPPQLNQVRNALEQSNFLSAEKALEKLDPEKVDRAEIKTDIVYYRALTAAHKALAGDGDITDAGKALTAFIKDNPTSFHFLEANEVIGDLLVANGTYDKAETFYKLVEEQSPWPDYKMRAGAARGRALLKQGKAQEALTVFDSVIARAGGGNNPLVARQRLIATVGKASCLSELGQHEEAAKLLDTLIAEADAEEAELHALAYNALGNSHRKAGRPKEARMAFLHTHILYPAFADAHAEALANLVDLWKELGDGTRSMEAQETLQSRYPNSAWARR
jgi:tetratricopeptide (TPR) repeat protein